MKRTLNCLVLMLLASVAVAQSVQQGLVMEYQGTEQKTPLANVEIAVRNAGRCSSDASGRFTLQFRTLHPGDRIEVREISRLGYEIFNLDAVNEWRIARDGGLVTLVLCRSERFKALKDKYNAIASRSYAEQEKKAEARLNELLRQGTLQQADYDKQLNDLRNQYEEQLENLDNYIDRFARIDLSELSAEERGIIELVQGDKMDEAIARYDKLAMLTQMERLSQKDSAIGQAVDVLQKEHQSVVEQEMKLYQMIQNQMTLLAMAGGKENFDRIAELHESVASMLSSQPVVVQRCATFFLEQREPKKSVKWMEVFLQIPDLSPTQLVIGHERMSTACCMLGEFEKALAASQKALDLLAALGDKCLADYESEVAVACNRGPILDYLARYDESEQAYKQAISLCDSLSRMDFLKEAIADGQFKCVVDGRFNCRTNLAHLYQNQGRLDEALPIMLLQVEDGRERLDKTNLASVYRCANALLQLGVLYANKSRLDDAEKLMEEAVVMLREAYDINPKQISYYYVLAINNLSYVYYFKKDNEKCLEYMKLAAQLYKEQCQDGTDESKATYAQQLNNLGFLSFSSKHYSEALGYLEESIQIYAPLCEKYYDSYMLGLTRARVNMMLVYLSEKRYEECVALDEQCLKDAEYALQKEPGDALDVYLIAQCNHGELLLSQGRTDEALAVWKKVIGQNPDFEERWVDVTFPKVLREKGLIPAK